MADNNDWIATLRSIIKQMANSSVTDLELQRGDLRLRLRRAPVTHDGTESETASPHKSKQVVESGHKVTAPLTGIFYAAPNPNAKPYAEVGDWVEPDTVVGLIETMKVFNEVVAECQGQVVAIQVRHGQLVHSGEPILIVDTSSIPDQTGKVVP